MSYDSWNKRGAEMLKSGLFSDICILVKDSKFACHRFMLARASEFFEKLFQKDGLKNGSVRLEETTPVVFQIILNIIYTGKSKFFTILKNDILIQVLKNANMWLIREVEQCCTELLRKRAENMNFELLIELYAEFFLLDNKSFLKEIIELLQKQSDQSNETFSKVSNLSFNCFRDFVQSTSHIYSESTRFVMVESWILKNVDFEYSSINDYKGIISNINFKKMTIQEFRDGPGNSILLADKDKYEILSEIAGKNQKRIFDSRNCKLIATLVETFFNNRNMSIIGYRNMSCVIFATEDFQIVYRRGNMNVTDQYLLELIKELFPNNMNEHRVQDSNGVIFVDKTLHTILFAKSSFGHTGSSLSRYLNDHQF
ncbi:uncharacterized protein Dana_GF27725 [Drosophila ananassae]|uniref:BTB domain-containing protein n=1 Tax=Drosophila ananassae TaxID=7217 RepID=A0A0P8XWB8_DROAN|nr:uncharacterized protein LOC26515134 [Drosophila ananassae]KPU78986.1 uncharacterized protein Dana_GF27725 [Drosophila ananassae]